MGPKVKLESNRVALVTGAGGTVGQAVCRELVKQSFDVVACDLKASLLAELIREHAVGLSTKAFDLTDPNACKDAIQEIADQYGRLDVLVNNAAIWFHEEFADSTDKHWEEVFRVNVVAPARLSRLALPLLQRSSNPRIVMVGSKNGLRSQAGLASYNASKAAVAALGRDLAIEFGRYGILVNTVAPGVLDTASNMGLISNEKLASAYKLRIPLRRFGTPEEISRAIAFLCSDECSFATGATFVVDGGQLAGEPGEPYVLRE